MRFFRIVLVLTAASGLAACTSSGSVAPKADGKVTVAARIGSASELVSALSVGPPVSSDPAAAAAVARAEQTFSFKLLQQVEPSSPGANVTVSPASLALALAMLENGAGGSTLQQIQSTLDTPSMSAATQDAGWAAIVATLAAEAKADGITFHSADALWLQNGFPVNAPFMQALARYFSSGVWQVDFSGHLSSAVAAINAWVSQQTEGKITQLFNPGQLDPSTVFALANAVYFHADWADPFDPTMSSPGPFYVGPGDTTQPTYMNEMVDDTAATSAYQLAELPYTGDDLEAVAVMPTSGSLVSFLQGLTPAELSSMVGGASTSAMVSLPKFTTTDDIDLTSVLADMGLAGAFGPSADFLPMSPQNPQLQSAVQRDYLKVAEQGTEAAAVTGISGVASAVRFIPAQPIVFNHPFLFIVREVKTGTILFASMIENPSS
jgi:serpin B